MRHRSAALTAVFLTALLLLTAAPLRAQSVTVSAAVNETTIGTQDRLRYSVEVRGATLIDVDTPRPPETEGLALLQTNPMVSQSTSMVNGVVSQSIGFEWVYRPLGEGTARLEATTVVINGESYTTEPIEVSVVAQARRPQAAQRPRSMRDLLRDDGRDQPAREVTERDLFIRVRPSAQTVYRYEQMYVDYELFLREGIQVRSNRLADSWDAEGFWREDLEIGERVGRDEVVDGLRYRVYTLKRIAVFPQRTGPLQIDPLRIETEVALPLRTRSLFDSFLGLTRYQEATVNSPPLRINVRPLPAGAPDAFEAAVGDFDLDAAVDRTEIETGETVRFDVTISGTGNIATVTPPELVLPPSVEQYPPQVGESINRTRRQVTGSKTFSYVLVPRAPGPHTLPAVEFAYFDPEAETYRTLRSRPVTIQVTGAPVGPAAARVNAGGLPIDDVAGLMLIVSDWRTGARDPLHHQPWPYLVLLLPLVGLIGLYAYRRHQSRLATDVRYARSRRAHPVARKHLKQAERLLSEGAGKAFYEEIARAVTGYIGDRLNIAPQGLTIAQLDARLAEAGVPEPTREALRDLLYECDRARFAPVPPTRDTLTTATERAAALIAELSERLA